LSAFAELIEKFDPHTLSPELLETHMWGFVATRTKPVSARKYLKFAEQDLREGDSPRHLVNAITNAKRALHLRMEDICRGFGFNSHSGPRNFPRMVEYSSKLGITAPRLLVRLNKIRNEVEHDYVLPGRMDVETFLDVADLFIASTDRWINRQPLKLGGYSGILIEGRAISLDKMLFDWPQGTVSLRFFPNDGPPWLPTHTVEYQCPSEEFFACAKAAIDCESEG
jgi:hypothetical protein